MNIKQSAESYRDYMIEKRRYFHQNPELSLHEENTTKILRLELEKMGIEVTTFPDYYGLTGVIKGGKPGKTVLLRADIDALPIEEHSGESFVSTNGNSHSCGHDCHMAMLLGAAKILSDIKNELCGNIKLLFQSAEELLCGAKYYVQNGVLNDIDAVFGMHIWATLDAHKFSLESGARMASADRFKIIVKGESTHGSSPHLGKDAVVAAASIVMNLQTYVSRANDPLNTLVISVGSIHGGQRYNIIADHVEMEGTIRTYSKELRSRLKSELASLIGLTAKALGCEAELVYTGGLNAVVNEHEHLNRIAASAAEKLYGEESLVKMPRLTGSEDFSLLMEHTPGFFGFIGCRNPGIGAVYSNHSDQFKVDESVLHKGAALYAQFAVDFLNEEYSN